MGLCTSDCHGWANFFLYLSVPDNWEMVVRRCPAESGQFYLESHLFNLASAYK